MEEKLLVRDAARAHHPLDGADAQALEGALQLSEDELATLRAAVKAWEPYSDACSECDHEVCKRERAIVAAAKAQGEIKNPPADYAHFGWEKCAACEGKGWVKAGYRAESREQEYKRLWIKEQNMRIQAEVILKKIKALADELTINGDGTKDMNPIEKACYSTQNAIGESIRKILG